MATTLNGTPIDGDAFLALRADWKAHGCPNDHPYLRLEFTPEKITPLVRFAS